VGIAIKVEVGAGIAVRGAQELKEKIIAQTTMMIILVFISLFSILDVHII
jgi:hypothetical protein